MKLFNYFATIALICVYFSLEVNAELAIETLNSAFFSKVRFEIRHFQDPVEQCAHYWDKIYSKLHSDESEIEDNRPLLQRIDVDLLIKVGNLLKARENRFGSSSLSEFTQDCIDRLYRSNNGNESLSPPSQISNNIVKDSLSKSAQSDDAEELKKIKRENEELMKKLDQQQQELGQKVLSLEQSSRKIEELTNELERSKQIADMFKKDKDKCEGEFSSEKLIHSQLLQTIDDKNFQIKELNEGLVKCQQQTKESCDFESTLKTNKEQLDKCDEELNNSKNEKNQIEQMKTKLTNSLDTCDRDLNSQKLSIDGTLRRMSDLESELNSCKSDENIFLEMKNENSKLKVKYDELQNKLDNIDEATLAKLPEMKEKINQFDMETEFLRRAYYMGHRQYCLDIAQRLNGSGFW